MADHSIPWRWTDDALGVAPRPTDPCSFWQDGVHRWRDTTMAVVDQKERVPIKECSCGAKIIAAPEMEALLRRLEADYSHAQATDMNRRLGVGEATEAIQETRRLLKRIDEAGR